MSKINDIFRCTGGGGGDPSWDFFKDLTNFFIFAPPLLQPSRLSLYAPDIIYSVFIKYCGFFFKNSLKFATSPSPALGRYWLYKKLLVNRSDCTLALP